MPVFPWLKPIQLDNPHGCGLFLAGAACLFPRRHDLHSPNGEGLTIHSSSLEHGIWLGVGGETVGKTMAALFLFFFSEKSKPHEIF